MFVTLQRVGLRIIVAHIWNPENKCNLMIFVNKIYIGPLVYPQSVSILRRFLHTIFTIDGPALSCKVIKGP